MIDKKMKNFMNKFYRDIVRQYITRQKEIKDKNNRRWVVALITDYGFIKEVKK